MTQKRALAIFETGQLVRIKKLNIASSKVLGVEGLIENLQIRHDEPLSLVIELEGGITLEFLGTWGTNGKACPRRP